jgi:hypothetical protein
MQGLLARHVNADEVDSAIDAFLSKLSESHCIVPRAASRQSAIKR